MWRSGRARFLLGVAITVSLLLNGFYLLGISPVAPVRQLGRHLKPAFLRKSPSVDVVVAAVRGEETEWLPRFFPQWNTKVYHVDALQEDKDGLQVPKNRGNEGMPYLR